MLLNVKKRLINGGGRPPLIFLHAFPLNARMWEPQLNWAADRWPAAAVDLRNFGGSWPAEGAELEPSVAVMADDVAETMTSLAIPRGIVCGLSMGGYVAMAFARRYAHRLAGLVLADTKQEADSHERRAGREELARTVLAEKSVRVIQDVVAPGFTGLTTQRDRPGVVARLHELISAARPEAVAWALRAMAQRPDSSGTLRRLAVPALIITGKEDLTSPVTMAAAMVSVIPDAASCWLPRAGHLSSLEAPDQFNAALAGWLARHSWSAPTRSR